MLRIYFLLIVLLTQFFQLIINHNSKDVKKSQIINKNSTNTIFCEQI